MAKERESSYRPDEVAKLLLKISGDTEDLKESFKDGKEVVQKFTKDIDGSNIMLIKSYGKLEQKFSSFVIGLRDGLNSILNMAAKTAVSLTALSAVVQVPVMKGFGRAQKISADVQASLRGIRREANELYDTLFQLLWPSIRTGLGYVEDLLKAFNNLSPASMKVIGNFLDMALKLGILGSAVLAVVGVLRLFVSGFSILGSLIGGGIKIFSALASVIGTVLSPKFILLAGAIWLFIYAWKNIPWFKEGVEDTLRAVGKYLGIIVNWVKKLVEALKGLVTGQAAGALDKLRQLMPGGGLYMGVGGTQLGTQQETSTGNKVGQVFREVIKGLSGGVLGEPGSRVVHGGGKGLPWFPVEEFPDIGSGGGDTASFRRALAVALAKDPKADRPSEEAQDFASKFTKFMDSAVALFDKFSTQGVNAFKQWREGNDELGKVVDKFDDAVGKDDSAFKTIYRDWTQAFKDIPESFTGLSEVFKEIQSNFEVISAERRDRSTKEYGTMRDAFFGTSARDLTSEDQINEFGRRAEDSMSRHLSTGIMDGISTGFDNAEQIVISFGKSMVQAFSDILAKGIITDLFTAGSSSGTSNTANFFGGLLKLFGGGATTEKHPGGLVRTLQYAHSGMAVGDVDIRAQDGEGIVSRGGMRALGEQNLRRLNAGGLGGGSVVNYNIFTPDAKSFTTLLERDEATIHRIVGNAIERNEGLRRQIRRSL